MARSGTVEAQQRDWIERAYSLLQEPHSEGTLTAFDRLDELLCDPQFMLQRGEMLWFDNGSIAHNRNAFLDAPDTPRTKVRMWTADTAIST